MPNISVTKPDGTGFYLNISTVRTLIPDKEGCSVFCTGRHGPIKVKESAEAVNNMMYQAEWSNQESFVEQLTNAIGRYMG